MTRRAWAICATLASAAAVVALMLYLRPPSARPSPPKRPVVDPIVRAPSSPPKPPTLAKPPKLLPAPLVRFEAEPAAPAWAADQAEQLRSITAAALKDLSPGAEIADLECRSRHCRFTLLGQDAAQLSSAIAALEDHAALRSVAHTMHLSGLRDTPPVHVTILLDMTSPPIGPLTPD